MPKIPKKLERPAAKKKGPVKKAPEEEVDETGVEDETDETSEDVEDVDSEEESEDEEEVDEEEEETPPPSRLTSRREVETNVSAEEDPDYLRPFQYKKVNDIPTVGGVSTDPDKGSKAAVMKASLLTQRRISVLIPLPEGSDPKICHSVTLNGYRLELPTNTYVDVPEQVAELIRNSNKQTITALNQFQVSEKARREAGY